MSVTSPPLCLWLTMICGDAHGKRDMS
jgi:hypothetical protein